MQTELTQEEEQYRLDNPFVAVLHQPESEGVGWFIQAHPTQEAAEATTAPNHSTEVMTWEAYDAFKALRTAEAAAADRKYPVKTQA